MTEFVFVAALLVLMVLLVLLFPLLRRAPAACNAAPGRQEAILAVFRDQMAELANERDQGILADTDFELAHQELRKRLLNEMPVSDQAVPPSAGRSSRMTALVIAIALPLLAVGGYRLFGTPEALEPLATMAEGRVTPEQIQGMVDNLAKKLKANPDDAPGWVMLARSYKSLGRIDEATAAYGKAEASMSGDPDFLAEYADLLAAQAGGHLDGKPMALINQALHLDPNHLVALWLAGTSAFNMRDYPDAAVLWERALKAVPEESPDRQMLVDGIAEAKRRSNARVDPGRSVAGRVELAPALAARTSPGDTVFVVARSPDGSRMPLAVAKAHVSDLPYAFVLDDSSAMMPDRALSSQSRLIVEARISSSGNAIAREGDLQSQAATVSLGEHKLRLVVDRDFQR